MALIHKHAVYGAEPKMADDAMRSLKLGSIQPSENPKTIADGLMTSLGTLTFPILQQHVTQIITVSEAEIMVALRFIWERVKLVIEPSAAVAVAALTAPGCPEFHRVGVILSGGNVDLEQLHW